MLTSQMYIFQQSQQFPVGPWSLHLLVIFKWKHPPHWALSVNWSLKCRKWILKCNILQNISFFFHLCVKCWNNLVLAIKYSLFYSARREDLRNPNTLNKVPNLTGMWSFAGIRHACWHNHINGFQRILKIACYLGAAVLSRAAIPVTQKVMLFFAPV